MNFLAPFKTRNFKNARERCVQRSRPHAKRHAVVALGALLFAISAQDLSAQVGDNNPGGHAGIFNGQVNTGCSYDPYTGNATRSITDIAVAGAVGENPLALIRIANSRAPSTTEVFGWAGGWNHNYNWILEDSEHSQTQNFHPASYTVEFPDGRVETFKQVNWDGIYRVRASNGDANSSAGVRERFLPLDTNTMLAYLVLPDGGVVEFTANRKTNGNRWWYKYHATAIHDPHGLRTQLVSSVTDNGVWRRLNWVIEPAGRSLHFAYTGQNSPRIASVTASDGRTVNYNYVYCNGCQLDSVVYYNNANWTAHYQYVGDNTGGELPPLLRTADDPMYAGPMHKIGYIYGTTNNPDGSTPAYGQIQSENYYDGTTIGAAVSTLTVGEANPVNHNKRKETRGDNATRTFTYDTGGYLTSSTDFMGFGASQGYDNKKYVNYVIDRRGKRTDYSNDPITGNVLQIQFPLTRDEDTPNQSVRPTVNYIYGGGAGCGDPNNGNPYWICAVTDEAGNQTRFTRERDAFRVMRIDYPDGGSETFSYDAGHFYQLQTHQMATGGTETWTYDSRHRKDTYRNPDNASGNPTAQYFYDALDRVVGALDALSHPTNWMYNDRNQVTVTTLATDPVDNTRHTITNAYNPNGDGTLVSVTDQLNHVTRYTYDDYRRLKSVTPPVRGSGDNGTYTTSFYYGANPSDSVNDYKLTDSNITWGVPASSSLKKIHTVYDDNRRKSSVTVAPGTGDEATTSYTYDNAGNVTWVTKPLSHNNVHTVYDARNRPYQITVGPSQTTNITYDTAGRTKEIDRPNGQVITYDNFDAMNRITQQSASNTRLGGSQYIRTSYSYYPSGPANLLNTFQDPHLFGGSDQYTYSYDGIGRKRSLQYPLNSNNNHRTEQWSYDAVGRLYQFTNRDYPAKTKTFYYDALNRLTSFSWDDGGITPGVSFDYDAASRLTGITNANAVISRTYFNDNLLKSETETATGGVARAVNHTYDADGNRASLGVPGYTFNYDYTNRNQLQDIINNANNANIASFVYNARGYVWSRTLSNSTFSTYGYDSYDRVTSIIHYMQPGGAARTVQYGYDDTHQSNNRLWAKRQISPASSENNKGEAFSYDLADQVSAFQLNVLNPNQVSQPQSQTMVYDPNGNRQFTPMGQYGAANDLSQYTTRTIAGTQTTAVYDPKGNTTTGLNGSTYTYDAQNRLRSACKSGGQTMYFTYDGLNRQVSRQLGTGTTYYSVWDGWDLVEDYHKSGRNAVVDATYVYGATGLLRDMENPNHYYYQDASGSISHVANNSGTLVEWYRYDMDGNPTFYDGTDHVRSPNQSGFNVRHLFTGQQWYSDIGLYDLRNRFYSPDIGRFLQPDPIGFWGGNNLYRYCRNNPVSRRDPLGLLDFRIDGGGAPGGTADLERVIVTGSPIDRSGTGAPGGGGGGGGGGEPGIGPGGGRGELRVGYGRQPSHVGNGTEQDPSNWGIDGDPNVLVNWYVGPPPNQTTPGAVFYGTNGGGYGATSLENYLFEVDPNKILVPVVREFNKFNMKVFGRAANAAAFQLSKVPTFVVAIPYARYTAAAVGGEVWKTGSFQPLVEFGAELQGIEGAPPTTLSGSLGYHWNLYRNFLLMGEPPGSEAYWNGP